MKVNTYKWSIEEWHELIDSGIIADKPVELLNGAIIEMSPEGISHSYTNDSVADYLREKLTGLAKIRESHPVTLDNSEPEPDIAIVRLPETIYRSHHPYPQDIYWLIEVSSQTLKKDLEEKSIIYARNSIPEYWVIDLVNKQLIVHTQPKGDRYTQIQTYTTGIVKPLSFANIDIALAQLLLF